MDPVTVLAENLIVLPIPVSFTRSKIFVRTLKWGNWRAIYSSAISMRDDIRLWCSLMQQYIYIAISMIVSPYILCRNRSFHEYVKHFKTRLDSANRLTQLHFSLPFLGCSNEETNPPLYKTIGSLLMWWKVFYDSDWCTAYTNRSCLNNNNQSFSPPLCFFCFKHTKPIWELLNCSSTSIYLFSS